VKRPRSHRRFFTIILFAGLLGAALCAGSLGPAGPARAAGELLVSNWSPAKGATGVALSTSVSVKFNQDIAAETVTPGTFYLTRVGDPAPLGAVALSYNATTRVATIDPYEDLQPSTPYLVTLTVDIESATGVRLTNSGDWTFTTDTPAQVLSRYPSPGAANAPTSANVSITFDKALDASTVNASSFHLESFAGNPVLASVTLSSDARTATLNPTLDLTGGMTYVARVENSVRTQTGVSVMDAPLTWSFSTILSPRITATVPASGAVNQAVNQAITVVFDQDMDQSTLTTSTFFVAKPGGSPLTATVTYDPGSHTATLTPVASYQSGQRYQVTLTSGVRGANGATLTGAPVTWIFTVLSDAPAILSRVPGDGATDVSVSQSIHVVFNVDMNPATISLATIYVQPVGGSPLVSTVTYNASTKTATIDPAVAFENKTLYQVTLSAAVLGQSGLPLADAPVIWFFTTETAADDFSDVHPGVTPYAAAIAQLADRGIITGFTDGSFRPYDPVSRQQFAKMIVLSLELPVTGLETCPFTDVAPQAGSDPLYPLKYVAVCAFRGITQGKTAKSFAPYESITRQQIITMVTRAARVPAPPVSFSVPFTKAQFSTSEHYQNACKAAYAGLLDGLLAIGPAYDFRAPCSRGECAQLLSSLIAYLD
jgi:hypothetical protein